MRYANKRPLLAHAGRIGRASNPARHPCPSDVFHPATVSGADGGLLPMRFTDSYGPG